MSGRMIGWMAAVIALAACGDAATKYDSGAVVLDISEENAFRADQATTPEFRNAFDALKVEDYGRAEALLDRSLALKPRDPYALLAMGTVHERTGRFYSAAEYYQSASRYGDVAAGSRLKSGRESDAAKALTVGDVARENLLRLAK